MPSKPARTEVGIGPLAPHGGPSKEPRDQDHLAARRTRVDTLDLAGVPIAEIARLVQVSHETVRKDLRIIRAQRHAELTELRDQALDREVARLERLRVRWVQPAEGGDIDAAKLVLAIHDRMARILGLNAPTIAVLEVAHQSPLDTITQRLGAIEARSVDSNGQSVNGNGSSIGAQVNGAA